MRIVLTLVIFYTFISAAITAKYEVDKTQKNMVKFKGSTQIGSFQGITHNIQGYVYWKDNDILYESELNFQVDLDSLDTGIKRRDIKMREKHLETPNYPLAKFSGKLIRAEKKSKSQHDVTAQGIIEIHGISHSIEVPGTMSFVYGGFRIQTEFSVSLSDYQIKIPKVLFFKVKEDIKLELDFYVKKADDAH
jgi:polyisoprenoid-binding protein YceI